MKGFLWVLFLIACSGLAIWIVAGPWFAESGIEIVVVTLFFMVHPFGALWMCYRAIRFEKRILRYVFFAMVPYSFVWYYFNRVRRHPA